MYVAPKNRWIVNFSLEAPGSPGLCLEGIVNAKLEASPQTTQTLKESANLFLAQECPGDWAEANMSELREFLQFEASAGTWVPLEGLPL